MTTIAIDHHQPLWKAVITSVPSHPQDPVQNSQPIRGGSRHAAHLQVLPRLDHQGRWMVQLRCFHPRPGLDSLVTGWANWICYRLLVIGISKSYIQSDIDQEITGFQLFFTDILPHSSSICRHHHSCRELRENIEIGEINRIWSLVMV